MASNDENFLPVMLNIGSKKILMIGAGLACREKLNSLRQAHAELTVISPSVHEDFLDQPWINLIKRKFKEGDCQGFFLVYAGVNDRAVEEEILADARRAGAMVNLVSRTGFSDFISPSVIARKNFSVFVSTYGKGPGATKRIRQIIEEKIDLDGLDKETGEYIEKRQKAKKQ